MSDGALDLAMAWAALEAAEARAPFGGGSLWALAAGLREAAAGEAAVLVVGHDRRLHAAALLSALQGGPRVVFPHAATPEVLVELGAATGARILLGAATAPAGLAVLAPAGAAMTSGGPRRSAEEPLAALGTGGTTGRSRLFWKSAENLFGEGLLQARALGVTARDVILACVPPNHIYGLLFSVIVPLLSGARVVAPEAPFPEDIAAALVAERATILVAVPPHYRALGATRVEEHALRVALSSAGPLDAADAARFRAATGVAITEIYGSTETGGVATRSQAADQLAWRPLDGVALAVSEGRLWVRSPFVSAELRDAAGGFLTADRAVPGAAAGTFELLGRLDGVVKVGGVRVELGDVRAALLALPGVTDAYVTAREVEGARSQEIVALFAGAAEAVEVRRALASRLPAVAVPRVVLRAARIPASASGKVERASVLELLERAGEGERS